MKYKLTENGFIATVFLTWLFSMIPIIYFRDPGTSYVVGFYNAMLIMCYAKNANLIKFEKVK